MWLMLDSQVLDGHIFGIIVAIYTEWASILLVSANQSIIMEETLNLPLIYICIKIGSFDDLYLIPNSPTCFSGAHNSCYITTSMIHVIHQISILLEP